MKNVFLKKVDKLFSMVTLSNQWNVNDQILFDVFGLTFYGYCFGVGRLICFLEPTEINDYVQKKLVELGAGHNYVKGLIEFAYSTFAQPTEGVNAQLVGIGHSHFSDTDLKEIVDSIFDNTKTLKS